MTETLVSWDKVPWMTQPTTRTSLSHHSIPPDACLLRYISATPVEPIGFTVVYVLTSTGSGALRICSVPAPTVRSPLAQIRRISTSGGHRSMTQQFSWILNRADRKVYELLSRWPGCRIWSFGSETRLMYTLSTDICALWHHWLVTHSHFKM